MRDFGQTRQSEFLKETKHKTIFSLGSSLKADNRLLPCYHDAGKYASAIISSNMKDIAFGLFLLAIATGSCTVQNSSERAADHASYVLTGEVAGFPDSTWLFLRSTSNDGTSDSALVTDGKFRFAGSVPDSIRAAQFILTTKNFSDYKFLWLENAEITLRAEKGKFRQATITGSRTQSQDDLLARLTMPLQNSIDSLRILTAQGGIDEKRNKEVNQTLRLLETTREDRTMEFIRQHPTSYVSAHVLSVYSTTWGKARTVELYNALSDEMKQSFYGKNINRYIILNKDIKPGDKFEDFEQTSYKNEKVKLSDFKGKIVLLEFWASNCGPCREENPALVKTYKKYRDKGFDILGVSLDEKKEYWLAAIEKDGLIWDNVSELNGMRNSAALIYGIRGIPDNFLIDRNGTIIDRNLRGEKLSARLEELLN